jgi:hypothetical protein
MGLTLTRGDTLNDCAGDSARKVHANANNGDGRSIDGLPGGLRATWTAIDRLAIGSRMWVVVASSVPASHHRYCLSPGQLNCNP